MSAGRPGSGPVSDRRRTPLESDLVERLRSLPPPPAPDPAFVSELRSHLIDSAHAFSDGATVTSIAEFTEYSRSGRIAHSTRIANSATTAGSTRIAKSAATAGSARTANSATTAGSARTASSGGTIVFPIADGSAGTTVFPIADGSAGTTESARPRRPGRVTAALIGHKRGRHLPHRTSGGRVPRTVLALGSVAAVLVLMLGLASWMSDRALPGDSLYAIKRASENLQLSMAASEVEKAGSYLQLAAYRTGEAAQLISQEVGGSPPSARTSELVRQALAGVDADSRSGMRLLGMATVHAGSPDPLARASTWLPQQESRLKDLLSRIPAGDLRDRAQASLNLLQRIDTRASQLAAVAGCTCLTTLAVDDLGPVPCSPCQSVLGPASIATNPVAPGGLVNGPSASGGSSSTTLPPGPIPSAQPSAGPSPTGASASPSSSAGPTSPSAGNGSTDTAGAGATGGIDPGSGLPSGGDPGTGTNSGSGSPSASPTDTAPTDTGTNTSNQPLPSTPAALTQSSVGS